MAESDLEREFDVTFSAPRGISPPLTQHRDNSSSRATPSPGVRKKRPRAGGATGAAGTKKARLALQKAASQTAKPRPGKTNKLPNGKPKQISAVAPKQAKGGKQDDKKVVSDSESESGSDDSSSSSDGSESEECVGNATRRGPNQRISNDSMQNAVGNLVHQNRQLIDLIRLKDVQWAEVEKQRVALEIARTKRDEQRIEMDKSRIEAEKDMVIQRVRLEESRLNMLENELKWLRSIAIRSQSKQRGSTEKGSGMEGITSDRCGVT